MSALLFHELNREQIGDLAPRALLVLPCGAIEQHGPHLAVGTDYLVVEHVARAAADLAAEEIPVIVAPTLPFGSSHHHLGWAGALSLGTESYFKAVFDLVLSLAASGFGRIFLLNGHGGNDELLQLAARDAALQQRVHVATGSYWRIAGEALAELDAVPAGFVPGHAGAFETSLLLAILPRGVASDRPHREAGAPSTLHPYRLESHGFWQEIDGYTDDPERGDASLGSEFLRATIGAVAGALVDFYRATGHEETTLDETDT